MLNGLLVLKWRPRNFDVLRLFKYRSPSPPIIVQYVGTMIGGVKRRFELWPRYALGSTALPTFLSCYLDQFCPFPSAFVVSHPTLLRGNLSNPVTRLQPSSKSVDNLTETFSVKETRLWRQSHLQRFLPSPKRHKGATRLASVLSAPATLSSKQQPFTPSTPHHCPVSA